MNPIFLPIILFVGFAAAILVYSMFSIFKRNKIIVGPYQERVPVMSDLERKIWFEEEVSSVFKLIEDLSLSLNKDEIAKRLVEEVRKFLNIDVCVLFLLDEHTGMLKIKYATGVSEDKFRDYSFKRGESISGWVMANNQTLVVDDLDKNAWFKKINKEDYIKGSFISVPLSIEGAVLGVMNVGNKKTGEIFTKEDSRFLANIAMVGAIAFQNTRLHEQMQESYLKTITALAAAIDAKDPYTKKHSENVTRYSSAIAKGMGCSAAEIETIRRAALLHDIGKIGIRDEILFNTDALKPDEAEQIKLHPIKGEAIVKSLSFLKEVSILIRHHHERYDGQGYPDGIRGHKIELGARILAVADSFDAMTSDRPYRKRLSVQKAKQELAQSQNTRFDPQVVECFLKILELDSYRVVDS